MTVQKNKVTVANFIFDLVYFTLQVLGNGQIKYKKVIMLHITLFFQKEG